MHAKNTGMPFDLRGLCFLQGIRTGSQKAHHRGKAKGCVSQSIQKEREEMNLLKTLIGAVVIVAGYIIVVGGTAFVCVAGAKLALSMF